jgi:hypothetical protein
MDGSSPATDARPAARSGICSVASGLVAAVTDAALSLESPRWAELGQAYGTAEDVPQLLVALSCIGREDHRAEVWFALWRTLYRPGEVYSASYAAVPHLLEIASGFGLRERAEALHLITRIEATRRSPQSQSIPNDLVEAYATAVDSLPDVVAAMAHEPWPADVAQICAAALLAGKRHADISRAVLGLGSAVTCPACGTEVEPPRG